MFGLFFSDEKVETVPQATACDAARVQPFFHAMLERGVYLAPSAYEAGFCLGAHDAAVIAATLEIARNAFATVARGTASAHAEVGFPPSPGMLPGVVSLAVGIVYVLGRPDVPPRRTPAPKPRHGKP